MHNVYLMLGINVNVGLLRSYAFRSFNTNSSAHCKSIKVLFNSFSPVQPCYCLAILLCLTLWIVSRKCLRYRPFSTFLLGLRGDHSVKDFFILISFWNFSPWRDVLVSHVDRCIVLYLAQPWLLLCVFKAILSWDSSRVKSSRKCFVGTWIVI